MREMMKVSTKPMKIEIVSNSDWRCDYTAADLEAYEEAVAASVLDYAATLTSGDVEVNVRSGRTVHVTITIRDADGRHDLSDEALALERDVTEAIGEISSEIFELGDFWSTPEP
jgi:hypothetical protein